MQRSRGVWPWWTASGGGWQDGESAGARGAADWRSVRIGANVPDGNVTPRTEAARHVLAAAGVPIVLVASSEGTGAREAFRRFLHSTIQPVGLIVAAELAAKLDTAGLALSFDRLMASDLSGRARAFQSMVGGGMALDRAAGLARLEELLGRVCVQKKIVFAIQAREHVTVAV